MGKILQLLLKQNIIPRCRKFWMSKGFMIWSKSSNFGAGTLRSMSLFWHDLVTEGALMAQSHIIPAAMCHRLHFWDDCRWGEAKWQNIYLFHQALQRLSFYLSVFQHSPALLPHWKDRVWNTCSCPRALYCKRAYGQAAEQYLHLQGLYLCSNEIQLGKVTVVQGQGETEILLCHLTKRERSPMSQQSHVEVGPLSN